MNKKLLLVGMVGCMGLSLVAADWFYTPGAKRQGDIVSIDVPAGKIGFEAAQKAFDLSKFDGKSVEFEIRARGRDVSLPATGWKGFKFMLAYTDGRTGEKHYPQAARKHGNFDWQRLSFVIGGNGSQALRNAVLMLGLQEGSGHVEFDLASLKFRALPPLWPMTNETWRCQYTPRVKAMPQLRGVMMGHNMKEDDFRTMHEWGVKLARFQMTRQWNTVGGNRDLADYDRYIDDCLDELERELALARKYGIRIVIDLHAAPGSRVDNHDLMMCYDHKYANHFIETWRKIARRFKGRDEVYGFDLVNEPQQTQPALPGCDYWSLQSRAAEAIREIDPETPVIIESNCYDSPEPFSYMKPLRLTNIIYQAHMYLPMEVTHQGVSDLKAPVVAYPNEKLGYNRAFLERKLSPVRTFEKKHGAKIFIGEFSAIVWAPGADAYIRDCTGIFADYGWDWCFHAFREWSGWSVEYACDPDKRHQQTPSADNPRKRALLGALKGL